MGLARISSSVRRVPFRFESLLDEQNRIKCEDTIYDRTTPREKIELSLPYTSKRFLTYLPGISIRRVSWAYRESIQPFISRANMLNNGSHHSALTLDAQMRLDKSRIVTERCLYEKTRCTTLDIFEIDFEEREFRENLNDGISNFLARVYVSSLCSRLIVNY